MSNKFLKLLKENSGRLAKIGCLVIFTSALGVWAGNAWNSDGLINVSCLAGLIGLLALCPTALKLITWLIRGTWQVLKRAIYDVFYEITKAMEDARKR